MTSARPPFWRDVRVLRIALQAVVVVGAVAFAWWLRGNVSANARGSNIPLGFGYLGQPTRITIPGSSFRQGQNVADALTVGFMNTLRVAGAGVVLATFLGTLIGIARLSTNWLLRSAARAYVELFRNVPLLVLVVFFYFAVYFELPRLEDATTIDSLLVVSIRGVVVPWVRIDEGKGVAVLVLVAFAVLVAGVVAHWRRRVFEQTGRPARRLLLAGGAALLVLLAGGFVLGAPASFTGPVLEDRRIKGGITMAPEFAALLTALVVYTASHIAEIVRGSILAVPKGQSEAATALALSGGQRMRLVVLPQAMRVAVPALANQYLNLTKNSSLAVAISYFELSKITQLTVSNQSPAVPSYALLLFVYLVISLTIALVANLVNRRLALVER